LERKEFPAIWEESDFLNDIKYLGKLPCKNKTKLGRLNCPLYNSMQEALHLTFNTVAAACHVALNFQTNFFTDYAMAFKSVYLDPLTSHW